MTRNSGDIIMQNRVFSWILLATLMILLIPLAAMQLSDQVVWTLSDFVVMGVLLSGMGSLFVLTARKVGKRRRLVLGAAFTLLLLYLWAELAVGIFTHLGS